MKGLNLFKTNGIVEHVHCFSDSAEGREVVTGSESVTCIETDPGLFRHVGKFKEFCKLAEGMPNGGSLSGGILEKDPFQVLDRDSVGVLVETAIEKGRATRPDLKIGICGEHGGEPNSVEFCHLVGMNYVSCSPYRVPIARLAAAHAQINFPRN